METMTADRPSSQQAGRYSAVLREQQRSLSSADGSVSCCTRLSIDTYIEGGGAAAALGSSVLAEVLGARRCIHTVPGKGHCRRGPGDVGWLRVMPACFEQVLQFKFKMGVKAPVGWPAGVYEGTSVDGKAQLREM
jgi:hypothetical protein